MHVLLIDDQAMFRQGLMLLLGELSDPLRFSEADSREQGLLLLQRETPDLILLDLDIPGASALDSLRAVAAGAPRVPIAVLSANADTATMRQAISNGASGYVPKSSNSGVLVAALRLILAGGVYLPEGTLSGSFTLQARHSASSDNQDNSPLSKRQTEVLLRAIRGQPNKVIAVDCGIAEGTVKAHLFAAFRVLGVHNRTEAVFAAAKLGLNPPFTAAD